MEIPAGLTKEHVIAAIECIDRGMSSNFGNSKKYDLFFNGKRYVPKAVIGIASKIHTGKDYTSKDFGSGQGSQCFKVLQGLGFHIIKKPKHDKDPMQRASVRHLMGLGIRPS